MDIDETIEFLVDTGASRTTLLDKDAIYMDIDYERLKRYKRDFSGIEGSVETYIISDALIILEGEKIENPIFVVRHPLEKMDEEEKIKILRIPSIMGRDVINRFRLIFNKEKNEIKLG